MGLRGPLQRLARLPPVLPAGEGGFPAGEGRSAGVRPPGHHDRRAGRVGFPRPHALLGRVRLRRGERAAEEETIRSLRDVIVRKQAAINEKGNYQRKLERLEADLKKASGFLFTGDSEAVSAELLKIVTDRATANGIGITRIDQAVKPERIPKDVVDKDPFLADFLRVKVVAYIKCTPDQLAKLLESLENLDKFAYVGTSDVKSFSVAPDKTVNGVPYLSTYIFKPEKKETDTKKKETWPEPQPLREVQS